MARIRYLKPDFFKDEDIAELPHQIRLFFAGLWTQADKAGRLEERSKRFKVEIFPYEDADIEKMLEALAAPKQTTQRPFIIRYEIEGEKYIQILSWERHQKPHHTEPESKIPPAPPLVNGKGNGDYKGKGGDSPCPLDNRSLTVRQRLDNGEGTVKQPLKSKPLTEYIVKHKFFSTIPNELFNALLEAHSEQTVIAELKKMTAWLIANPKKQKKNYKRFIVNWFNRNREGGQGGRITGHTQEDRGKYKGLSREAE